MIADVVFDIPLRHPFSYTVPGQRAGRRDARGSFITAGSGDRGPNGIVRAGDTSPEGLREKVDFVVAEMERRLRLLGFSWNDAVSTQAYTVQNIGHLVGQALAARHDDARVEGAHVAERARLTAAGQRRQTAQHHTTTRSFLFEHGA